MKRNKFERLLSGLLAFVMIMGMIPTTAFAAEKAEIVTELDSEQLIQGRVADGSASFQCGIEYRFGGGTYNTELYPEPSDALKEKYPEGMDVTSWFVGGLPEGLTARISDYYGTSIGQSHVRPCIEIGLYGIPTETTTGIDVTIKVPGVFYQDSQPVSFHSEIIIEPLGSACSGCTFKTINEMQVCYKEGKGIHVCETNFGSNMNGVGDKYDKNPQDGYISAEEEPSRMTDTGRYWYFFDIEEVEADTSGGFFYLNHFANLRTVNIDPGYVVIFGENNAKLESINLNCRTVTGLDKIPSSAPLQKIEIKWATVDRLDYNFPMLEKLVLTDSVIDGEADDQIFITKDCAALKHIDLNGTDISHNGSDTNISYDLANLEYLDINYTGIKNVNIAYYSKLKYFYARDNGLDKIIGARGEHGKTLADKCPELREVDISGNNVSQFDLGAHQNIRKLDLSNNKFTTFAAQNLPALKEFRINQQNEAGSYTNDLSAVYLTNVPALEYLDVSYQMNPSFGLAIDNAPKLKELDAEKCLNLKATDIPVGVKKNLEILNVNECTSLNEEFTAAKYPKLKELYAKNVTIGKLDGTKGLFVSAPNVEVIEYKGTNTADWVEFRGTNKLELFVLQGSSTLKSVTVNGASSLERLYLGNNTNLAELTLTGTYALRTLDIHVDDPIGVSKIKALDLTDCYSIQNVGVSKGAEKMGLLYPSHPDYPDMQVTGWIWYDCAIDWQGLDLYNLERKMQFSYDLSDHGCNHYKGEQGDSYWWKPSCGNAHGKFSTHEWRDVSEDERYITWNTAVWSRSDSGAGDENKYTITYNFSPYKESSEIQKTTYAVNALTAEEADIPGLVGWATKKFATESEIAYRPGQQIIVSGDIELWPVYNTKTIVYYSAGNYSEDIGWNIEADEVDGLEEFRSYEYKHTFYGKSSLSDYWTFDVLDLTPTREGYIFKGWKYGNTIYQPGDEMEVVGESSIDLSAKWEKVVEMPSAYTYLSCNKDYFKKGDTLTLTAKVVGLNGADVSETQFKAFLYLYEEGKESEKTQVAERTFTGDEVDLTFAYPADDTRIAYVEIFAYTGGNYSQKSITDDYELTPAKAMDVEFLYSIGDGYVKVTEDTTIVLQQGANDGWLDIEVDAIWGKGELDIRLYEINSNVTVGTEVDNVVSTNTIGTKSYRARVKDETGNSIYTEKLTVKIVPPLEITGESEDTLTIAMKQDVVFTVDYKGYVGYDGEYLDELYIKEWDSEQNKYIDVPGSEIVVNANNTTSGTIAFVIPVSAPASGDYEYHRYYVYIEDMFGNDYEHDVEVEFDRTNPLTFAVDGRGTIKFYDYYNGADYAGVFANGTDVAAVLDGGWVYDITDKLYDSTRAEYPDNVLVPTLGTYVNVEVKLWRYESYEAYKNDRYDYVNAYEGKFSESEFDSYYYVNITEAYASNEGRIPGTVDYLGAMEPGYYTMTLYISNRNGLDLTATNSFVAEGGFEVLATGAEHVHDYKAKTGVGDPHIHTYECICGDSYTENHVFPADYPVDGQWNMNGLYVWNDEGTATIYKPTNTEFLTCTACGDQVHRWRFLESFTIDNADLQEGKTDAYEKMMDVDQTFSVVAKLDFLEELNPELAGKSVYKRLSEKLNDFWPVNTKVNWTSTNQDVATVDENGVVTAVGEGTALITATTVQPGKETGEPMTVTILINVNCQHTKHMVKVPAKDPTCQADGHVEHYMCLDCTKYSLTGDFTDTVSYENDIKLAQVDHVRLYGVWHSDANGHWRECKFECGTRYDEQYHYSTVAANCQHPEYCAVCDYVLAPITAHSHSEYGWSDGYHWSICECGVVVEGSNEVHQFGADGSAKKCDDCGYEKTVGYTVSGTITSYLKNEGDITVQLLSGESVAYSQVFNTYTEVNASRKEYSTVYSIPAVVDGTYTLRISKANHVTRDYTVTVSGGVLTQDAKIHLKGDITGDGRVNTSDVAKANAHARKTSTLVGYEFKCADITGEGKVNTSDVAKANAHAKKTNLLW